MAAILVFQIGQMILIVIDQTPKKDRFDYYNYDYKFDYKNIIQQTMAVNILIILFTSGLVINFGILLVSIGRLVSFLTGNKYLRGLSFLVLVPVSLLYGHEAFQMMAFYWAATAYDFN